MVLFWVCCRVCVVLVIVVVVVRVATGGSGVCVTVWASVYR